MSRKKPQSLSAIIVARHFGVHRVTVHDWFQRGCPRTTIKTIQRWRAANLRSEREPLDQRDGQGNAATPPGELTLQERRIKADTQKIESDVELRRLAHR